jgi:hypothetical protein
MHTHTHTHTHILSTLDPVSRFFAFQTLHMWVYAVIEMISSSRTCARTHTASAAAYTLTRAHSHTLTHTLLDFVWSHWDDAVERICYQVRDLFESTLCLHGEMSACEDVCEDAREGEGVCEGVASPTHTEGDGTKRMGEGVCAASPTHATHGFLHDLAAKMVALPWDGRAKFSSLGVVAKRSVFFSL